MRARLGVAVAALTTAVVTVGGVAAAGPTPDPTPARGANTTLDEGIVDNGKATHDHDEEHGGTEGHLLPTRKNVKLVGRAPTNPQQPGRVADVGVFGNYAYLGAFREPDCQKGGVHVFDIANPAKPKDIGFIPTSEGSYVGEGVHVVRITTPVFKGDVLVMNNEICGDSPAANGGMNLVDVTNPRKPVVLAQHAGDVSADGSGRVNQIHSAFLWDAGDRAYAVIVDDEETTDVDILDITNPRAPVLVGEYDLAAMFPQILQENVGLDSVFLHDMVVKKIRGRWVMLASYWDGGYVLLDVTDPTKATYIADSDFTFPDPEAAESGIDAAPEGNAHQAEFTRDNKYIVAADEDFSPFKVEATNTSDGTEFTAAAGSGTPGVPPGGSIEGTAVYVGLACAAGPSVPPASGPDQIAVAERGTCSFQEKHDTVKAAGGYKAILVMNREESAAGGGCDSLISMQVEGDLPAFFVGRRVGYDLFDLPYDHEACLAGDGTKTAPVEIGTVGDTVSLKSVFDGWGYVHLYATGKGKLTELDTYAIPEAHDARYAQNFGDLSVHEAATSARDSRLVYLSYYAGGFRVARIVEGYGGAKLREVGRFIGPDGNNFWGVEVFTRGGREYVAASDRDFGLYIFEYTGP